MSSAGQPLEVSSHIHSCNQQKNPNSQHVRDKNPAKCNLCTESWIPLEHLREPRAVQTHTLLSTCKVSSPQTLYKTTSLQRMGTWILLSTNYWAAISASLLGSLCLEGKSSLWGGRTGWCMGLHAFMWLNSIGKMQKLPWKLLGWICPNKSHSISILSLDSTLLFLVSCAILHYLIKVNARICQMTWFLSLSEYFV